MTATPEQWANMADAASDGFDDGYGACILELRARVEALEANSKPTPNSSQIRSSPDHFGQVNKMVAGSLVERVQGAIHDVEFPHGNDEARAAIRVVAEWLREEGYPSSPSRLEREVGQ